MSGFYKIAKLALTSCSHFPLRTIQCPRFLKGFHYFFRCTTRNGEKIMKLMFILHQNTSICLSIYLSIYLIFLFICIHYLYDIQHCERFFDSRYEVCLLWHSNLRHSNICSDLLSSELASLIQGHSSRCDKEAHKFVPGC